VSCCHALTSVTSQRISRLVSPRISITSGAGAVNSYGNLRQKVCPIYAATKKPCNWNGSLEPGVYAVAAANGTLESPKSSQIQLPPPVGAPIGARRTALAGALDWLAWVPAWLRADRMHRS
jgi:hypothetical protein